MPVALLTITKLCKTILFEIIFQFKLMHIYDIMFRKIFEGDKLSMVSFQSVITSMRAFSAQLPDIPDKKCNEAVKKWKQLSELFTNQANELEQSPTPDCISKTRTLIDQTRTQLLNLVCSNSARLTPRQFVAIQIGPFNKALNNLDQNQADEELPEGLFIDEKGNLNIPLDRLEQLLPKALELWGNIKVGEFTYDCSTTVRYKMILKQPPLDLVTPVVCLLQNGVKATLSITQARILLGKEETDPIPKSLEFPDISEEAWNKINKRTMSSFGTITDWRKIDTYLNSEEKWYLETFLRRYRPKLLEVQPHRCEGYLKETTGDYFAKNMNVAGMMRVFPEDFALDLQQFLTQMTERLNQLPDCQHIALHFDLQTTYVLTRTQFSLLLLDSNKDFTFQADRETTVPCLLKGQQTSLSGLEVRILLGLPPFGPLPEKLDLSEIDPNYLPLIRKIFLAKPYCQPERIKADKAYYLNRFLSKHRPELKPITSKSYSISVSKTVFKLSKESFRSLLQNILDENPAATEIHFGKRIVLRSTITSLLNNPQFQPKTLQSDYTILLSDGFYHRIPFDFAHEALDTLLQAQQNWVVQDIEELKDWNLLPDLPETSPETLHDALRWYRERISPTSFKRHEAMALFFQTWSPNSKWETTASEELVDRDDMILMLPENKDISESQVLTDIAAWIKPYQATGKKVQIGQPGARHSRLAVLEVATEQKLPLSFLTRDFWCRLADGSTQSLDLLFLSRYWESYKNGLDPKATDSFASKDRPIEINLSPEVLQDLQRFTDQLDLKPDRALDASFRNPPLVWELGAPNYSVSRLLEMREFIRLHRGADCIEAKTIGTYLATTSRATLAADWSNPNVWSTIQEQLKKVRLAHVILLEGIDGEYEQPVWWRHEIEAYIDHGQITPQNLTTQQIIRPGSYQSRWDNPKVPVAFLKTFFRKVDQSEHLDPDT